MIISITLPDWWDGSVGILAVIALIFAIVTEKKAQKIVVQTKMQLENIADVFGSLSTKYVGHFPGNMEEITKLVSNTKRSLVILSDVPAYGQYSNPLGFPDYKQAINELLKPKNHILVTLITGNKEKRRSRLFCFPK